MSENKKVVLDCSKAPNSTCSVAISGNEEEVLELGMLHASVKHGIEKNAETKQMLRSFLKVATPA